MLIGNWVRKPAMVQEILFPKNAVMISMINFVHFWQHIRLISRGLRNNFLSTFLNSVMALTAHKLRMLAN